MIIKLELFRETNLGWLFFITTIFYVSLILKKIHGFLWDQWIAKIGLSESVARSIKFSRCKEAQTKARTDIIEYIKDVNYLKIHKKNV